MELKSNRIVQRGKKAALKKGNGKIKCECCDHYSAYELKEIIKKKPAANKV